MLLNAKPTPDPDSILNKLVELSLTTNWLAENASNLRQLLVKQDPIELSKAIQFIQKHSEDWFKAERIKQWFLGEGKRN